MFLAEMVNGIGRGYEDLQQAKTRHTRQRGL